MILDAVLAIKLEPLEHLNNKAWLVVLGVDELVRFRCPFIRRVHALRPELSPDGRKDDEAYLNQAVKIGSHPVAVPL